MSDPKTAAKQAVADYKEFGKVIDNDDATILALAREVLRTADYDALRAALECYADNDECSWGGLDNTGGDWRGVCEDNCRYCRARAALDGEVKKS
jgi:hypothetical protein